MSVLPGQVNAQPQKRKRSRFVFLLGVLFICLLLVGGGGFYFLSIQNNTTKITPSVLIASKQATPTPSLAPLQKTSDETLPDTIPTAQASSVWKTYKTSIYSMNYLPTWQFDYYAVANGVKIYNPKSINSRTSQPLQYVTVTTQGASESASTYVDGIQFACCIGPSATPGNDAKFQKQILLIGSKQAIAYTPIGTGRTWDIVLSTGKHLLIIYSSLTSFNSVTVESQMIQSLRILE